MRPPYGFRERRKALSPAMTTRSVALFTHRFPTGVVGRRSIPDQPHGDGLVPRGRGRRIAPSSAPEEVHDGLPEDPRGDRVDVVAPWDLQVAAAPVAGEPPGAGGESVLGPCDQ